jgi:glycosyltransferase involved in cell wall biosynthesis
LGDALPDGISTRISVIVPVFNADPAALAACIESVRRQSYSNWELCICDNHSDQAETIKTLDRYRGIDARIKMMRGPRSARIFGASNRAVELATCDYLAFLDHDDLLHRDALLETALAIEEHPDIDLLYTDEDQVTLKGDRHGEPYYKPDWSPDHLHSVIYFQHMLVIRRKLFLELGGFREKYSGAQDHDLVLRAASRARRVHHIPQILYHQRMPLEPQVDRPSINLPSLIAELDTTEAARFRSGRKGRA